MSLIRRRIFVAAWVLLLAGLLNAQNQQNLAVLDLEALGISEQESKVLTERLRAELVRIGLFQVLERGKMQEVLNELGFQETGCVSNECVSSFDPG